MTPRARLGWRTAALVAVGVGLLALAYHLRHILNPLLIALGIAYVLQPLVVSLEKRQIPLPGGRRPLGRTGATVVIFAGFLLLFALTLVLAIPVVVGETGALASAIVGETSWPASEMDAAAIRGEVHTSEGRWFHTPARTPLKSWDGPWPGGAGTRWYVDDNGNGRADAGYARRLQAWLFETAGNWRTRAPWLADAFDKAAARAGEMARARAGDLAATGLAVAGVAGGAVASGARALFVFISITLLIPFYTFFFLRGLDLAAVQMQAYIPAAIRPRAVHILSRIHRIMAGFIRGRAVIAVIVTVLTTVGLLACSVPYAVLLGLVTGIAIVVPFLAVLVGFGPAALLLLADGGGVGQFVALAMVCTIVHTVEGFWLVPKILGKESNLHPVTAFVSIFIGAELLGLLGAILAIPLAATVKILVQELLLPEMRDVAGMGPGTGGSRPPPPKTGGLIL